MQIKLKSKVINYLKALRAEYVHYASDQALTELDLVIKEVQDQYESK